MSLTKYAEATVLDQWTAEEVPFSRTAHRHAFSYTPRPGYIYVRSRMISSRCNDNYDEFPAAEIKQAYRTFIGKPVFVNHHNSNHRRARGVVLDAALHEDVNPDGTPDTWVEGLMEVDAKTFPMLAEAIRKREIERTSMGTDVAYSVCTACGNRAETPADYCKHIPTMKGMKMRRANASSGAMEEVVIAERCYGLRFFENSLLVEPPADPTAYVLGFEESGQADVPVLAKSASRGPLEGITAAEVEQAEQMLNGVHTAASVEYQVHLDCGDTVRYIGARSGQVTAGQRWSCATHGPVTVTEVGGPGGADLGLGMDHWGSNQHRTAGVKDVLRALAPPPDPRNQCTRCGATFRWAKDLHTFVCPRGHNTRPAFASSYGNQRGTSQSAIQVPEGYVFLRFDSHRAESKFKSYSGTDEGTIYLASLTKPHLLAVPPEMWSAYVKGNRTGNGMRGITVMKRRPNLNDYMRPIFGSRPAFASWTPADSREHFGHHTEDIGMSWGARRVCHTCRKTLQVINDDEEVLWTVGDSLDDLEHLSRNTSTYEFPKDSGEDYPYARRYLQGSRTASDSALEVYIVEKEPGRFYYWLVNTQYDTEILRAGGPFSDVQAAWKEATWLHSPSSQVVWRYPYTPWERDPEYFEDFYLRALEKKSSSQRTADATPTKAPAQVDTLREENCPVCGDDAYNGDRCAVCGYMLPPEQFRDPDLDKAKQVDLRQQQNQNVPGTAGPDPTAPGAAKLTCTNCGERYDASGPTTHSAASAPPPSLEQQVGPNDDDAENPARPGDRAQQPQAVSEGMTCPSCGEGTLEADPADAEQQPEQSSTPGDKAVDDPEADPEVDDEDDPEVDSEADPKADPEADPKAAPQQPGKPWEQKSEEGDLPNRRSHPPKKRKHHEDENGSSRPEGVRSKAMANPAQQQRNRLIEALQHQHRVSNAQRQALVDQQRQIGDLRTVLSALTSGGNRTAANQSRLQRALARLAADEKKDEVATTDEQALAPAAKDDPEAVGASPAPANAGVTPDAVTDVQNSNVAAPTEPFNNLVDVTKPENTDPPKGDAAHVETEVRVSQPSNDAAFAETGWKSSSQQERMIEGMRLARLRKQTGIHSGSEDDLVLGQRLATDRSLSLEAMRAEVAALEKVAAGTDRQGGRQARNLVPRSASGRGIPSVAASNQVSAQPSSEEFLFD